MTNYLLFITIVVCFVFFTTSTSQAQSLSSSEIASVEWLIKQYGSDVAVNEAAICAAFTCNIINGNRHITSMSLSASSPVTTTLGPPDSSTTLDFPELKILSLYGSAGGFIGDVNQNTILKMRNMHQLTSLSISYDNSLTTVPVGFPSTFDLPLLEYILFAQSPITTIPGFFNQSNLQTINLQRIPYLDDLQIDNTISLPDLANLVLETNIPSAVKTIDLIKSSFPKLLFFMFTFSNTILNINLDMIPGSVVRCKSGSNATYNLNVINTQNIIELLVGGAQSTVVPSPTTWPNLKTWEVQDSPLTNTYPFSVFPQQVKTFSMTMSKITSIPTTPLSLNLTKLSFSQSTITGDIQWQYFNTQPNGFEIDLSFNTGITGVVPDSMCPYKLRITQTAISSLPSCYFCYYLSNSNMITSTIPVPQDYNCTISFESYDLVFLFGYAYVNGTNIGIRDSGYQSYPPPKGYINIELDSQYPLYTYNMSSIEVGMDITSISLLTLPQGIVTFRLRHVALQMSIPHHIVANGSAPVLAVVDTNFLYINLTNPPDGLITFSVSNSYFTAPPMTYDYQQGFPIINTFMIYSGGDMSQVGTEYLLTGTFEPGLPSESKIYFNGDSTICNMTNVSSNTVRCLQTKYIQGGSTTITFSNNGFLSRSTFQTALTTPYMTCMESACQAHGTCEINGGCVCKTGYYGVNCTMGYPKLSSGSYVDDTLEKKRIISLFGDFSVTPTNVAISINGTWTCTPVLTQQLTINCSIGLIPTTIGLVSVGISVNGSSAFAKDFILFRHIPSIPSSSSSSEQSSDSSNSDSTEVPINQCPNNCFGHGECINSKCKCFEGYNVQDNCLTKIINNNTITPNTTAPTTSFDIDGVDFQFEIVAIQEIDGENNIVQELLTDKWNATIYNDTQTTTVNYQLNATKKTLSMVSATISFSSQPRDIPFGLETLHINANSIKVSVNISDWQYQSFLTTLRVIFKTTLSKDQSFEFDCQQQQIDSLQFDQLSSSIQYLRVVKDNIQFTGRFIDYVLSDGRPSFSKTYLINQTQSTDDEDQITILIGISTPQCQSCILDPDFTPLLIDKSEDSGCEKKSNAWRIAVGVSVGGAALIAAASAVFIHRYNVAKKARAVKSLQRKLHDFSG
ncbi:hypothetical protein DFA_08430 [Cavenderia fasciculata]|uniref:EGF-like domain-containing protein n=1 Tax=Cavenderia fasciculata TaxID=261658 RepID=F4Q661_CACFS|nr:uncharacterized protein DFA_08430 [Cavenderia fasciculata]EGG17435.1 hypothetical protein DFA_08430 [Cavenderia fasciculata]|eukprot:XP_004355919.1 hypothetical protein DFA_08430 [Cavenderia fasciculata]